jgi:superfamily II DNA or RNA helicase
LRRAIPTWWAGATGFNRASVADAMGNVKLIGDAVEHWGRDAYGMRTIGFEMSRRASLATVDAFRASGVEAAHIDGTMHRDLRRELFARFRAGDLTYLSQVAIAGEGVDIPGAECALLRYKTNSLTKFLQDCGRVFRPLFSDGFDPNHATDAERVGLDCRRAQAYRRHPRHGRQRLRPGDAVRRSGLVAAGCEGAARARGQGQERRDPDPALPDVLSDCVLGAASLPWLRLRASNDVDPARLEGRPAVRARAAWQVEQGGRERGAAEAGEGRGARGGKRSAP